MYYEQIYLEKPIVFAKGLFRHEAHNIHIHESLEVGLILEHEVSYRFGDRVYTGGPGDIFVCRPFEPHWGFAKGEEPTTWHMLLFSPSVANRIPNGLRLLLPFYTQWLKSPLIPADCPQAAAIRKSFDRAGEVLSEGPRHALEDATHFLCLIDILLQIYDYAFSHDRHFPDLTHSKGIVDSVRYLLTHFTEDISIETVTALSGQRKSAFFKAFQAFTGLPPHQFLLRLRLQYALDALVRLPEARILQICEDSGFQSLRAFNKQFKAYTGLSPRAYRSQWAGNVPGK